MGVVERARQDLERGEPWRARDRLRSTSAERSADEQVQELLGEVLVAMGDLPAAGAAYLLSSRADEQIARELAALERRYPRPQARADALRARGALEDYPPAAQQRLRRLQAEVEADGWRWEVGQRPQQRRVRAVGRARLVAQEPAGSPWEVLVLGALAVALVGPWCLGVVAVLRRLL